MQTLNSYHSECHLNVFEIMLDFIRLRNDVIKFLEFKEFGESRESGESEEKITSLAPLF